MVNDALIFDLAYGDIVFEEKSGVLTVTHTKEDGTQKTIELLSYNDFYTVTQSGPETAVDYQVKVIGTSDQLHVILNGINIDKTDSNAAISVEANCDVEL